MKLAIFLILLLTSTLAFGQQYYSGTADPHFMAPVASVAALPVTGSVGDYRIETTTFNTYAWNGAAWVCTSCAAGGVTVTTVSVVSTHGLSGTVANPTTTPAITLSTPGCVGVCKSDGTSLSTAAAGTDYQAALGFTAENVANKDTDATMAANSDVKYPSQKAVKTALAGKLSGALTTDHLYIGVAGVSTDTAVTGDLSNIAGAFTVNTVGTSSAANIHSAELAANAATATPTASTIAKWDASSNFSANAYVASAYMQFNDAGANNAQISAPAAIVSSYNLVLPTTGGNVAQLLQTDGLGNLEWADPGITINDLNSFRADEIASKSVAMAVSTVNLVLSGVPASADVDDIDFSTGGTLLVRAQTDPTENGLWTVNPFGAWSRDASMSDNGTSCMGALVNVQHGGTNFGDTLWISKCDGSGAVPFVQSPFTARMAAGNLVLGNAAGVATSVAMSGEATISNAGVVALSNAAVIGKVLTGFLAGAGVVAATDSIVQAIDKIVGNIAALTFANIGGSATQAQLPNMVRISKVANYTLLTTDTYVDGNGTFNFTLPVATSSLKQPYVITNIGAGVLTVLPNGADTIISIASITINPGQSATLSPDGVSNWTIQ